MADQVAELRKILDRMDARLNELEATEPEAPIEPAR